MKRRTEITVETDRIILVRRRRVKSVMVWCAVCDAESLMFPVDEAARLLGTSSMSIFRRADAGELHWLETPAGSLLICRNSLLRNQKALPDSSDHQ